MMQQREAGPNVSHLGTIALLCDDKWAVFRSFGLQAILKVGVGTKCSKKESEFGM